MNCPRCQCENPDAARFCRGCGLKLEMGAHGVLGAGRAAHREPLPPPAGFVPIERARDLYYRWEAAGGGAVLLGTGTLALTVFNGGYDLAEVVLRVRGTGDGGAELFCVQRDMTEWSRGGKVEIEIPSYELPAPVRALSVELSKAEFSRP